MSKDIEPVSIESAVGIEVIQVTRSDRMRWLRESLLPIVSLIAAVVGLTMAYFTVSRSLQTGKQLNAISENQLKTAIQLKAISENTAGQLKEISDNQTTKYVGEFPGCLKSIVNVLNEAEPGEEILIVSDFPGYGIYSDHSAYLRYQEVLEEKELRSPINMVVLDHTQRLEVLEAEFGRREFEEITGSPAFKDFLNWAPYKESDLKNAQDLCIAIENEQIKTYESRLRSIKNKCESHRGLPILLWIVSDKVAVFSIPNLLPEKGAVEEAFETRDQRLINQLKVIAGGYSCK
jgi:hypothetical protein